MKRLFKILLVLLVASTLYLNVNAEYKIGPKTYQHSITEQSTQMKTKVIEKNKTKNKNLTFKNITKITIVVLLGTCIMYLINIKKEDKEETN